MLGPDVLVAYLLRGIQSCTGISDFVVSHIDESHT